MEFWWFKSYAGSYYLFDTPQDGRPGSRYRCGRCWRESNRWVLLLEKLPRAEAKIHIPLTSPAKAMKVLEQIVVAVFPGATFVRENF